MFSNAQGRDKTSYTYRLSDEMLECSFAERAKLFLGQWHEAGEIEVAYQQKVLQ